MAKLAQLSSLFGCGVHGLRLVTASFFLLQADELDVESTSLAAPDSAVPKASFVSCHFVAHLHRTPKRDEQGSGRVLDACELIYTRMPMTWFSHFRGSFQEIWYSVVIFLA